MAEEKQPAWFPLTTLFRTRHGVRHLPQMPAREELTGTCSPGAFTRAGSLPEKINRMHEQIRSFVSEGGGPSDIKPLMQEIDRLLQAAEFEEAELLIDQVLEPTD